MDIGKRIAQMRRERGISQEELAELALLHRVTVAKYETGQVEPGAIALIAWMGHADSKMILKVYDEVTDERDVSEADRLRSSFTA